jgi:hypothetical protein
LKRLTRPRRFGCFLLNGYFAFHRMALGDRHHNGDDFHKPLIRRNDL